MSSKPKKQEYKASEQEKVSAAVSKAEKEYFDQTYGPLLREMRDLSEREDLGGLARGAAQADTMQALSSRPSLAAARSVDQAADLASAASAQQLQGSAQALGAQRERQIGVLGTARGQAADAQAGLARAAKIQSTKQLEAARAKQMVRQAKFNAAEQIGGALLAQGSKNMSTYDTPNRQSDANDAGFFNRFFTPYTPAQTQSTPSKGGRSS
jgi:hypothetical protein